MGEAASTRWFSPQKRDTGLATHARHRVELAGSLRKVAWPELCPSCGGAATERIPVTKVFLRQRRRRRKSVDDVTLYSVQTLRVPFCGACASRHRDLERGIGIVRRCFSYVSTIFLIPLLVSILGLTLFAVPSLLGPAGELIATPKRPIQAAAFAACAVIFAALAWHQTRRWRVPPQTEVTSSFDFSDNLGDIFHGERRIYAISNAAFADSFKVANADRAWTDERRARADRRGMILGSLVAALLLVAVIVGMLSK
jgi:hypothetical protein